MRTVRDADGTELLLLKESSAASLVRNPETGAEFYAENETLTPVSGTSPLQTAATALPESPRSPLDRVNASRARGLLVELHEVGPLSIRAILSRYELCESDVHCISAELQAADLIEPATVAGERGYALTDEAAAALSSIFDRTE